MAKTVTAAVKPLRLAPTVEKKDGDKPYLTANIDRAIVMTQYDLRGFAHPMGMRLHHKHPKYLDAMIINLVAFAANVGHGSTDPQYVSFRRGSFKDSLAMCKRLASCCEGSEKEAIQLIIREFLRQHKDMAAKIAAGKIEDPGYLKPITTKNPMGRGIIALARAFDVKLPSEKKKKK